MANELRHSDVGTALSKTEWEAVGSHVLNSQAAGDLIYASSTSQLSRLAIGSANQFLVTNSGGTAPAWTSSPAVVTAITPDASDGATLGTAALEWSDLYLADAAVIYFGDDDDVTLTHVHNDGLLLSSTDQLQFGDSGTFIHQSSDGVLTIQSDTTVDINGAVALNGAITGATNITLSGELDAATLDLSSSADIAGDLVLSGGADGALQFTNAGENSIKIPDNQASALIIEEANNAYITFVTTNSSEAITVAKATTFSAGITNAGTIAAGTWNGTAIASTYIAADAITGAKIADDAIDSEHYTDGSIDTAHLASDVITGAKIADDAIDSEHYTDGSIDAAHLAADAVTGAKIADDAIDSEHYTDGSIDNAHIADNAIDSEHYADGSIDNAHIADDAIDSEHYAAASIDFAHIQNVAANSILGRNANSSGVLSEVALATTQILIGDGTGFTAAALSSDVTMTNAGAVTIANNAVSLAKMAGLARGKIIYGDASGDPAALAVGTADQVLTHDGTDISWEDAGGGGGTFTAVAIEDLVAGEAVALVNDSGTVKVEKIRGMSEFSANPQNSYDALSNAAYRKSLFHCPDIDKWCRVFIDNGSPGYYLWIQIGDYDTTTKQITWGEAVAVNDFSSYPQGGCWVGGSFDRVFACGGNGSNDVKGYLYEVNTSTNKVVTADGGGLYGPGTGYTITDGDYEGSGIFCHFATTGEAANKIIVCGTRDESPNERMNEIHALTPTGGSTNTVTDYIAGEMMQNVRHSGAFASWSWNDNSTGKGLFTYTDGGDSNYFKAKSFIMNDTPGWTFSSAAGVTGTEILGADVTDTNAGCDLGRNSITADTSNGNFVVWLKGASDGAAKAVVVKVADDGTITTHGTATPTTVFANMGAHTGIAADFSDLGGIAGYGREKTSTTSNQGLVNRRGVGIYDPDTDAHIFMYWLEAEKLSGWTEYSMSLSPSWSIRAICTITLAGTNDLDMTIGKPDWFAPIVRGHGGHNIGLNENGYAVALAYDTTHDQALFEEHCHDMYVEYGKTMKFDAQFLFQGSTLANKYRRSNMDNFIGFNTAAVDISSSTAATITVKGGLNENQSGLTKGQKYWITDSGTLRTTYPSSAFYLYKAGIATDTTKLLVQADYITN